MWADGSHGDGADARADDGAAGGEIIRGGAGGGGKDEAIAVILGDGVAIGRNLQANEAAAVGLFEHDVVEAVNGYAATGGAIEHGALADLVVAFNESGEVFGRLLRGVGGEEAELTHVDAEHGAAGFKGGIEHAEQGAVAADRAAEVLAYQRVGLERILGGDGGLHAFALGDAREVARGFFGAGLGGVDRESDGFYGLHRIIQLGAGFRRG